MGDAIAHRGPDAEGFWIQPGIGLVHRRLSIIDLSGGDQPIGNEDDSVQIIFNGEIYNFQELRAGLEARGHCFRTRSDTEVIVHLYEEEGEQLVQRLRGMFAFALWDSPRRRLVLGRDRLGIKPLYVYRDAEKLIFGSELKAILAHPNVERALNTEVLEEYLAFGMVSGASSIFKRIEKLPPAHVLVVGPDSLNPSPRRYWQLRIEPDHRPTMEEWQERIRAKVAETVRQHLIADVPVGAFLSGGLDSSLIVASCAGQTNGPLQSFAIGFHEEAFSELPYARMVAEQFGTKHVEEVVTPDAATLIDQMTQHYDEPFADQSAIPTFLLAQVAARNVKVVLSGDGGDEAFGGYTRYPKDLRQAALRRWLPRWFRRAVLGPMASLMPETDRLAVTVRAKTLLTNLSLDTASAYANSVVMTRLALRRQLLARDVVAQLNGHRADQHIIDAYATAPAGDVLAGMIAADANVLLPDDFLVKMDRASMAHGLEVRPPLLDHELFEMTAQIPSQWKIRDGKTKWILKQTYQKQLPAEVVWRPKQGFEIPIDDWLRGPLRPMFEAAVFDPKGRIRDFIDQTAARKIYHSHLNRWFEHALVLWPLLVLARWAERYLRTPV
jgi:asparagine synthase (glutamine-hydrolysing)